MAVGLTSCFLWTDHSELGRERTSHLVGQTAATESFPDHAPPVLPPTLLPASDLPDRVGVLLVDTSSRIEDRGALQACSQECPVPAEHLFLSRGIV